MFWPTLYFIFPLVMRYFQVRGNTRDIEDNYVRTLVVYMNFWLVRKKEVKYSRHYILSCSLFMAVPSSGYHL